MHLRHARHFNFVLLDAEETYRRGKEHVEEGIIKFEREWEQIRAGFTWAAARIDEDEWAAKICSTFPTAGSGLLALHMVPISRVSWLEAALKAARKMGFKKSQIWHLNDLGMAYLDMGKARMALECHKEGLKLARTIHDKGSEGSALGNLGNAYMFLGEKEKAIACFNARLEIAKEMGDREGEASYYSGMGSVHFHARDFHKAIQCYEMNLHILRELGDKKGEGAALANLGNTYTLAGDSEAVRQYYEQALSIFKEIGDKYGEGKTLSNLGNVHMVRGETGLGVDCYQQALKIAQEFNDKEGEANDLANLGMAYHQLGEKEKGLRYLRGALVIFAEIGSPKAQKVRERLDEWGAKIEPLIPDGIQYTGYVVEEAIKFYEKKMARARARTDKKGEGHALANLGYLYHLGGDIDKGIETMKRALDVLESTGSPYVSKVLRRLLLWGVKP